MTNLPQIPPLFAINNNANDRKKQQHCEKLQFQKREYLTSL